MSASRPVLHHTPERGWVNDPVALVHHEGRYHLFFQFVPGRTTWALECQWGHATSEDLLTWRPESVALAPGCGEDGCWSGSLVRSSADEAVIFYTGVDTGAAHDGRVRRALPTSGSWEAWQPEDVVVTAPEGEDAVAFRDPFVHRYGEEWRMLVGGGLRGGEAVAWMFASSDLREWRHLGRAASRADGRDPDALGAKESGVADEDGVWTGSVWECPVLVEVGGRALLLVSVWADGLLHYLAYAACDHQGDRLVLGPWRQLSYGPGLYACTPFVDAEGEPGIIAWIREVGDVDAGWMGAHSLPYRLRWSGDVLVAAPHPVVASRRGALMTDGRLPAVADLEWAPRPGDRLDASSFRVETGADLATVDTGAVRVELPWAGEPLRLVLDGPVLEVFGEHGVTALPVAGGGGEISAPAGSGLRVFGLG